MRAIPQSEVPNCPDCSKPMVKRSGKFGEFWGCSTFPRCRGIRNINENKVLRKIENPSVYQRLVFDWLKHEGHAIVSACAGSGKTTTIEHFIALLKENDPNILVIYAVFNTHVKNSAVEKGLPAMTTHQLGFAAIRNYVRGKVEVDEYKVSNIIKGLIRETWDSEKWMISPVSQLVSKLKNTLVPMDNDTLDKLTDRFQIETNGSHERIYNLVRLTMEQNNRQLNKIDFDDQLYLPWKFKMPVKQYKWLLGDEVQDWNRAQIELVLRSITSDGRILAVGDRKQSMYGFRGADIYSMDRIQEALGAVEMPLSITYRCPRLHVELVNRIFPEIPFEVWENAKEGEILSMSNDCMLGEVKDGDLVLCRTNAPLVKPAFALIRRGIKAIIRGRDIGKNLISLIEKFEHRANYKVDNLIDILEEYRREQVSRLLKQEKTGQAQSLEDKVRTIYAMCDECNEIYQVKQKINEVFTDIKEGVIFSTVHRAKGDEAENVYILQPQLMPHPMAQQDWEIQQEKNIMYVALTRSKNRLVFVGGPAPVAIWDEEIEEELEVNQDEIITEEVIAQVEELLDIKVEEVHKDVTFGITDEGKVDLIQLEIKDIPICPF